MEVALRFDWPNHEHVFHQVIRTTDHYNDVEINFCLLCNEAAGQSGIPENRHFEHPKGCKCYWCVYCVCPKLLERERQGPTATHTISAHCNGPRINDHGVEPSDTVCNCKQGPP